jgi:hypothetical protein
MSKAKQVIPLDSIVGDDEKDTLLLRGMANEAERYIRSFAWCLTLKEGFFADGFGGIVAIFLFRADIAKLGEDQWTWIFVGDIPPAYLEMDHDYRRPPRCAKSLYRGNRGMGYSCTFRPVVMRINPN